MDTIRTFGSAKVDALIAGFEAELQRVSKDQGEEPVHKLRVSIRRLQQALRVFRQFVDKKSSRKVRSQMRRVMKLAGTVREHDIGMQLLNKANLPHDGVREARDVHSRELARVAGKLSTAKWRDSLGVGKA